MPGVTHSSAPVGDYIENNQIDHQNMLNFQPTWRAPIPLRRKEYINYFNNFKLYFRIHPPIRLSCSGLRLFRPGHPARPNGIWRRSDDRLRERAPESGMYAGEACIEHAKKLQTRLKTWKRKRKF
jgi:hypothetical protein